MNILEKIVGSKKQEVARLHEQYDVQELRERVASHDPYSASTTPRFYRALAEARAAGTPFFIAEFKRKSPSEGWINHDADLPAQILAYARSGAGAISVLTDTPFFGGSYDDLQLASQTLRPPSAVRRPPLLLQKDFIIDPIQVLLAKLHGADIILLIAAILEPERLDFLKKMAESLGMGVLVEVHDADELDKIRRLDFPVLGINNRDLKTFRTALNRVNVLTTAGAPRYIIAESGVRDYRDFQAVRRADGFLIGTGLMRSTADFSDDSDFADYFWSRGRFLFKACGIRTPAMLRSLGAATARSHLHTPGHPDFIGINFSPVSKRRISDPVFQDLKTGKVSNAVAVFYKNTETKIREILGQYPFRAVQLYAGDVTPAFVRSLKQRVLLAVRVGAEPTWEATFTRHIEPYAADVDFFILDGALPGSGERIGAAIPADFPYPFLLAGGLHAGNLELALDYKNCIGVDIASGIESAGQEDAAKVAGIVTRLAALRRDLVSGILD